MSETDLQYGGGYVYQWECALLLALNHFFEAVRYDPTLFDLVQDFLGEVAEMQLEGEDRENGVELEDINLINGDRRILIQVKTKQAEGKPWTLADPLLLKALYRFYESRFSAEEPDNVRFVFLTNRPFHSDLVEVKFAIKEGAVDQCAEAARLCQRLSRYAEKEKKARVDVGWFYEVLARTALVEYLSVDAVKANVQAKLQAYGRPDWREAHALLFEYFTRQSTRMGGGVVTRASVAKVLGPPRPPVPTPLPLYAPPPPPVPDTIPDPGPLPPGFRIPFQRNALFTGRVGPLQALARALLAGDGRSALVTQAVAGMGGMGKTQLAVEFAYRYGRFFHGVHWVNAGEPEAIGAEVAACGEAMSLPDWPEKQPEQVARTLGEWQRGGPRLVVLDNLEEVGTTREWLARLSGGAVRVLVTARRTDWPGYLGLRQLRLESFTPEESRAFLRQHLPDGRATEADLQALAERLYHLPLALELAGRYLGGHARLSVEAYLGRLESMWEHPSMAGWREELGNPTGHDLRLAQTFAVSWERVEDETARRVFLLAGYCAPNQPIPCEVLEEAAGVDREACDGALGVLTGLGLLELGDPEAGPTVHPLLAEYGCAIVPSAPEGEGVLGALADALARLARAANDQMDQTGSPSHFVPLLPHVRPVAERAEEEGLEDAANLWNSLGYHLDRIADLAGARAAFERALAIDERAFGPDHPNVARDVNNLGLVLKDLGDLAGARAAYERALAIDEQAFGPDHPQVAIFVNNLGRVLQDLGDLAGARAAFERALAIFERVLGSDHPNVATLVNNLGSVLQDLGELAGARAAYERALAIDERAFGPDHPNVATDVNNLGSVLQALGDLAGARAAYERAQRIFERFLPPEHPYIRGVRGNLEVLDRAARGRE